MNKDFDNGMLKHGDYDDESSDREMEIGFCVFNWEPVCVGPNYQPYECPKNADGCKFNLNDTNCIEYLQYFIGEKLK